MDGCVDAAFSITVWFHLEHLSKTSEELFRVLKSGGHFIIITADPDAYDIWKTHYDDIQMDGKKFIGKARVLLNPDEPTPIFSEISKNTFYLHTLNDILSSLKTSNLLVENVEKIGYLPIHRGRNLFVCISGKKV